MLGRRTPRWERCEEDLTNVSTRTSDWQNNGKWARGVTAILGIWLFISAFLWPHSTAQMTNTWILGVLAVVFAAIAAYSAPQARYLNTALAVWLFISAFTLPRYAMATVWNNAIVAILIFAASLVPSDTRHTLHGPPIAR